MASRYWVGGTANWDATAGTKWATTSGGGGGSAVPTSADDVFFDGASGAVTVTLASAGNCKNLDFTGFTGTFAGSSSISIYGNLTFVAGMTKTHSGGITFRATSGTKTITTNGISVPNAITFNGSGGTFQLQDNLTVGASRNWTLTAGTFDPNGKTVSFTGQGVQMIINGAFTFYNLTFTGSSTKTDDLAFASNVTVSNAFTVNGNSVINRVLISSSVIGTSRTLTVATVSFTNVDLRDITGAGAGSWNLSAITGLSGDCGGNSGITFTSPATSYWVPSAGTSTGSMSAVTRWASATGGTAGTGRAPLPQDTSIFDANSIDAGSRTITQDMARIGNVDWTGATNTPTWTTSTTCTCFGSITLISGMTLTASTQAYTFMGRGTHTITSAGKTWAKSFTVVAVGGTYTLQDNLTSGATNTITLTAGTLDFNNFVVSIGTLTAQISAGCTISLGSATHLITGTGSCCNLTQATMTANTATLKFTNTSASAITFNGNSKIYNNVWFDRGASAGSITISGSNTFNDFKDTGTVAHSLLFTASTTQYIQTFTVVGSAGQLKTINSTTTAVHYLVKTTPGQISCDYLNIQHSIASGANVWYAGLNSTNNQGVATAGNGWVFSAPKQLSGFFGAM